MLKILKICKTSKVNKFRIIKNRYISILLLLLIVFASYAYLKYFLYKNVNCNISHNYTPQNNIQKDNILLSINDQNTDNNEIFKIFFNQHKQFIPVAKEIYKSCIKLNVPFKKTLAIAILESGWGEGYIAKKKKNYFSIGAFDNAPYRSASDWSKEPLNKAVYEQIKILKKDFYDKYGYNLKIIGKHYAPNNPKWAEEVQQIIELDLKNLNIRYNSCAEK